MRAPRVGDSSRALPEIRLHTALSSMDSEIDGLSSPSRARDVKPKGFSAAGLRFSTSWKADSIRLGASQKHLRLSNYAQI